MAVLQPLVPTEAALICVEDSAHGLIPEHAYLVVRVAVRRVQVEDKEEVAALECDDLVAVILERDVLVLRGEPAEAVLAGLHQLIEGLEELVAEVVRIGQVPAAPAVLVAAAILRPREVNPLRVPELVAHEVQIPLAAEAQHQQPDHLVHGEAPVDAEGGLRTLDEAHAGVHLCVHEPEGDRLVADNRLVVGLDVRDDLLLPTAVGQRVGDVAHVPAVVGALLQELDEHVGDGHGQAVVEAEAAVLDRPAERGHAAHVLAHGDGAGNHAVDQVVREHQVDVAVDVGIRAEVLMVPAGIAFADSVRLVEHGGDAVEAEAIEAVLLQPPLHVRKQEAQDLVLGVVEDLRVPIHVVPLRPAVGVAMVGAVHLGDAVHGVGGGVRMDQVHQHHDAQAVGRVDHLLELLGRARAARGREEGGHVVAEAAVVRVLGNGHELHGVVAQALDARQHVPREVQVRGDLRLEGGHAHVRLVDLDAPGLRGPRVLELVALVLGRLPKDAVKEVRGVILPRELRPGRHAVVPLAAVGLQADLELAWMRDHAGAVLLVRQLHNPLAEALATQRRGVLPAIELADEEDLLGVGEPLAVGVAALHAVEAERLVALRELVQAALVLLELRLPKLVALDAVPDLALHALERRVEIEDGE
mmetsp:Transcript_24606/g.76616  ORF Transcript_24606/g.76616 Transcript_24606/m.76616 type:complete len:642 (+) Transcript_24606:455-2380(+)